MAAKGTGASVVVLALLVLGAFVYIAPEAPVYGASTDCTPETDPFSVTGATWGTTASPASAYPGEQSVPLTITMLFSGPCTSPETTLYLGLAEGLVPFTGPAGSGAPSIIFLNTSPNTIVTETFSLDINQNAQTGVTYNIPLIIDYSDNTASDVITQINATNGALVASIPLYGQASLAYSAGTTHVNGGAENNVTITIANTGAGTTGPVSTTVTAPSGVTLLNGLGTTGSLAPGASYAQNLEMFVSSSLSGSAFVLTFSSKYLDQYSNSQTAAGTLGFTVPSATTVTPSSAFMVEGASWGSAGSSSSPLQGTQDQALVVTLQYLSATPVTSLEGSLALPSGITDLNGAGTATAFSAATTNQYGTVQLTFYVDLSSSLKAGSVSLTLTLEWMTSQSMGLTQTAVITPPPIAQLESSFQVDGASWGTASSTSSSASSTTTSSASPTPGTNDEPLVVSLQYLGTTSVSDIEGTLTLPSGITNLNGGQTATAFSATATANQVVTLTFYLDVSSSATPGSYSIPIALSWVTSVSSTMTQAASVTPPPIAAAASTATYTFSLTQENSTITTGSRTSAGFVLTNAGTGTVYSPSFALTTGSPVVIYSVGPTIPATQLAPGQSETFTAQVTAGPSATPGIYSGSLSVTFTDSSGSSHTQTFPLSFTVNGLVTFVLQDTSVSQSINSFTVTGSILNEGTTTADYASITATIEGSSATADYIGDIATDTPTTFSLSIPFTAPTATSTTSTSTSSGAANATSTSTSASRTFVSSGPGNASRSTSFTFSGGPSGFNGTAAAGGRSASAGGATILVTISYQNAFGSSLSQSFPLSTTVKTSSQLVGATTSVSSSGNTTNQQLQEVAYGVVATLVLVLIAGAVMLRRYRKNAIARLPPESRADQSVI